MEDGPLRRTRRDLFWTGIEDGCARHSSSSLGYRLARRVPVDQCGTMSRRGPTSSAQALSGAVCVGLFVASSFHAMIPSVSNSGWHCRRRGTARLIGEVEHGHVLALAAIVPVEVQRHTPTRPTAGASSSSIAPMRAPIDRDRHTAGGSGPAPRRPGHTCRSGCEAWCCTSRSVGYTGRSLPSRGRDADGAAEVRLHRDHHAPGTGRPTRDPERERRSPRSRDRRRRHVERRARPADRSRSGLDALGERERIPVQRLAGARAASSIPRAACSRRLFGAAYANV
jgi:hypothetical protein